MLDLKVPADSRSFFAGEAFPGIYEWSGKRLRLCLGVVQPTEFKATEDPPTFLVTLKRAPK